MSRYIASFNGAMQFPDDDVEDVAAVAHKVIKEAQDAGVWIFAGFAS